MSHYRVCFFGVKETTRLIVEYLHAHKVHIDLIISIDESVLLKNHVADYCSLAETAKRIGADFYCVKDYSLKRLNDEFFAKHTFGVGIVYGWQRLIPSSIISKFQYGIFGFHASPEALPGGRGRSPLNWGIILGKKKLYNHCFKYVTEADAGEIYSVKVFSITSHDTIMTVLYKSLLTAREEIIKLLQDIKLGPLKLQPQNGKPWFFPKRTPEDGLIDFTKDKTNTIINLVRGVSRPFPGAFCYTYDGKLIIWEAWEFDRLIDFSAWQPGQVVDVLYEMPVVRTIDGSIVIRESEGPILKSRDLLLAKQPPLP
ncbi:Polymyxin resistance protein PmrI [Legionella beliardensis]|uniref:Polymyxin resistance protein PmrI n=1 Tax=Legionella beliardensis TaxID=91822 RepID=A0A378I4V1_9GAMM|nr:hypothetical protein [Legionella beliardensis]STX29745.1 Polymyxin resistance protein PmrI [Legionella beliardensis]